MSGEYRLVKVFDLSQAPGDLRDADDLAALRPDAGPDDPAILSLTVGDYAGSPANTDPSREITYTEFQLHRWLEANGASKGEVVLISWDSEMFHPLR